MHGHHRFADHGDAQRVRQIDREATLTVAQFNAHATTPASTCIFGSISNDLVPILLTGLRALEQGYTEPMDGGARVYLTKSGKSSF
jgi:hypothetical protein